MYNGEGAGKVVFLCTQTHTPTKSSAMGAKIAFPKARSQVRVGGYLKASLLIQTTFEIEAVQNNETIRRVLRRMQTFFPHPFRYPLVAPL